MNALDLSPQEAWDHAEEEIDLWQEGRWLREREERRRLTGW